MPFPSHYHLILDRIKSVDPVRYGKTRNYHDGAISKLSPYISRGVISTQQVFLHILSLQLPWYKIEKFVQELAWRDYWQQVWIVKGHEINQDLKRPQEKMSNHSIPQGIIRAQTGIHAIDKGIRDLYETGYMHNHMRMYVASLTCNIGASHWRKPAQWMYSHLLDGDWASNALSWQWVAGANANKKYYANQENINKYFNSDQRHTFMDVPYGSFEEIDIPASLKETTEVTYNYVLPATQGDIHPNKKSLIYNYYNLDPKWRAEEDAQRILLIEPSFFEEYPVQQKCIDFMLSLSANIEDLKIFVAEFDELEKILDHQNIIFKEHPTNEHYRGLEDSRDWMFNVKGYFPSFFGFWKKCKKEIKRG